MRHVARKCRHNKAGFSEYGAEYGAEFKLIFKEVSAQLIFIFFSASQSASELSGTRMSFLSFLSFFLFKSISYIHLLFFFRQKRKNEGGGGRMQVLERMVVAPSPYRGVSRQVVIRVS